MRRRIDKRPFGEPMTTTKEPREGGDPARFLHGAWVFLFVLLGTVLAGLQVANMLGISWIAVLPMSFFVFALLGGLGWASYVLLGFFTLALIGFLLPDMRGDALSVSGGLLWLIAAVSTFLMTVNYYAHHIMPSRGDKIGSTGSYPHFRLLLKYAFRSFVQRKPFNVKASELQDSFKTLGAGILPSYRAIKVKAGDEKGYYTPGQVVLTRGEKVESVVDLRPYRQQKSEAFRTRDGVYVDADLQVTYHVKRQTDAPDNIGWSYDDNALKQVDSKTLDGVSGKAIDLMKAEFNRRSLEELEHVYDDDEPFTMALLNVTQALRELYEPKGITIERVAIVNVERPEATIHSRTDGWLKAMRPAPPSSQQNALPSEGDLKIQMEVLDDIKKHIDKVRKQSNSSMSQELADRLDAILYDIATDGILHTLIPPLPEEE